MLGGYPMDKGCKGVKLYNVLFPVWMLLLFPQVWLVVLPGNFIIDSIVLILCMSALKINDKKSFYKRHVLKIFGFGMLSDFIGALFMLLAVVLEISKTGDELYFTIPATLISAACIYIFNYFITFKKTGKITRRKLSLVFAIATAPYTFLIPLSWIYR